MQNRFLTLVIVVVVGVFIGVTIVKKQTQDSQLSVLLKQQTQIINGQKQLTQHVSGSGVSEGGPGVQKLLRKQQILENRIATLENQIKTLQAQVKNAPAPVAQQPPQENFNKVHTIDVADSYVKGKKDAPVTIVEFIDFQCPFCARFHPAVMEAVNAYPKEVNYIVKNFPLSFHQQAPSAAKAAYAAGEQGKYFEMVDKLLENNRELGEELYKRLAKELGLNVKRFLKDYADKDAQWQGYIDADIDLGRQVDVRGTPTMYINGKKTNARDLAAFQREIDAILKK